MSLTPRMALLPPRFCSDCGAATEERTLKPAEPKRAVCTACARIHYLGPRVAAGVYARHGEGLLFIRRGIEPGYGLWSYPGGFVDIGETPEQAAVRETREEVGVDVRLAGLIGVYSSIARDIVIVVYEGAVVGGEPRALDEVLEVRVWAPAAVDPAQLAFDSARFALRDFRRRYDLQ